MWQRGDLISCNGSNWWNLKVLQSEANVHLSLMDKALYAKTTHLAIDNPAEEMKLDDTTLTKDSNYI